MISLKAIASSRDAQHYFERDNYYAKDEGYARSAWGGKGAEALGLDGPVTGEAFKGLLDGHVGEQELGRVARDEDGEAVRVHRAGWDLTFSAPKSVSLLAEVAGDARVREAHERAVDVALAYLEHEAARMRVTQDGDTRTENTANLIVAKFFHNTSRELDPQTHTHAVVINATQSSDGRWRSLANEEIFRHRMTADSLYRGELAHQLTRLGYELDRQANGRFEISGFNREQLEAFSQRSRQIEGSLAERGLDRASATVLQREVATLNTRRAKKEVSHEAVQAEWRSRASQVGLSLSRVVEAARGRSRGNPDATRENAAPAATAAAIAAVRQSASHLTERQSVIERQEVVRHAAHFGLGQVAPSEILKAYGMLEAKGEFVATQDGRLTTPEAIHAERTMLAALARGKGAMARAVPERSGAGDSPLGDARYAELDSGQRSAAELILGGGDRYVGVQGYAGTGKTTMLNAVREVAAGEGYEVRGFAVSASAALVLEREAGIASQTVASFTREGKRTEAGARELWIVDEASLLGQRDANAILRLAERANAKVAFVGDAKQLGAVEAGKPFELLQANGMATAHMTEIKRQRTEQLKSAVQDIIARRHDAALRKLDTVEIKDDAALIARIARDIADKSPAARDAFLVVTATNRERQAINDGVRELLKAQGAIGGSSIKSEVLVNKGLTQAQKQSALHYAEGDVVRFGRDYRTLEVTKGELARVESVNADSGTVALRTERGRCIQWTPAKQTRVESYGVESREIAVGERIRFTRNGGGFTNGQSATVEWINGREATLRLDSGERAALQLDRQRHWDYSYATTIHASQGRTAEASAIHITAGSRAAFGERSFYVAATRAREQTTIYTDDRQKAALIAARPQQKESALESLGHRQHQSGSREGERFEDRAQGSARGR
jgi:conjugative relaxase-like TrwC/TraI family protein